MIVVLGYYDRNNLGDEAYKITIPNILKFIYAPFGNVDFKFICIDDYKQNINVINNAEMIIVGGGDLINIYFYNKLIPILDTYHGIKIAFSIGVPFPSLLTDEYFKYFDYVFVRNNEDVDKITEIVGSSKVIFIPDAAFNLCSYVVKKNEITNNRKKCGIFLVQNMIVHTNFVKNISKLIESICDEYDIIFYRFNTSLSDENDSGISEKVCKKIYKMHKDHEGIITVDYNNYSPLEMLDVISKLDKAICMRYHSHIFCMIAQCPFISISSTRKTRSLMTQANLNDYQYKIYLDANGKPVDTILGNFVDIITNNQLKGMRDIWDNLEEHTDDFIQKSSTFTKACYERLCEIPFTNIINNTYHKDKELVNEVNSILNTHNRIKDLPLFLGQLVSYRKLGYPDSNHVWGFANALSSRQDIRTLIYNVSKNDLPTNHKDKLFNINAYLNNTEKEVKINFDINEYQSFLNIHRAGWWYVIEGLLTYYHNDGIYVDLYTDRTFSWTYDIYKYVGKIPYTHPWIGFIHHTENETYSPNNLVNMLNNKDFQISLKSCKALFVMSKKLKEWLESKNLNIRIFCVTHPTIFPDIKFNLDAFRRNEKKKLVQVGGWLRNPFTIYTLGYNIMTNSYVRNNTFSKAIILTNDMQDFKPPENLRFEYYKNNIIIEPNKHPICTPCRDNTKHKWVYYMIKWLMDQCLISFGEYDEINHIVYVILHQCNAINGLSRIKSIMTKIIKSVEVMNKLNDDDYDELLSKNIVFLDMIDAAAVNSIIECIVRNTPVLVNRITGTEELLGHNYPLFYNANDCPLSLLSKLDYCNILSAVKYLSKKNKDEYKLSYFLHEFSNKYNELFVD